MPENHPAPSEPDARHHTQGQTHLLVVEDEPTIRELFAAMLREAGYSVAQAENGFGALEEIRRHPPALVLSDLNMPRMTGFELISVIRRRFPAIHIIAMSGAFDGDAIPSGVGADAYYQKAGRQIGTLVEVIESILAGDSAPVAAKQVEDDAKQPTPSRVSLWVSRRANPVDVPHILLTCLECLRSFANALPDENGTMQLQQTPCIFCGSPISFALLDRNVTHSPGCAPVKPQ